MFGALYSLVLLATFGISIYEHENMFAADCDALHCTHYTRVAAPARHAMRSMSEYTCMPESDRGYHVDSISHDCAVSCISLERLALTCHAHNTFSTPPLFSAPSTVPDTPLMWAPKTARWSSYL